MNQDFGLALTPAIARRLLRFQCIFDIQLPSQMESLAKQDQISENDFDEFVCQYSEEKKIITQFLVDCNLRGIIQQDFHPTFSEVEVMNAIKIAKPESITVFSSRTDLWRTTLKSLFMQNLYCYSRFDIKPEEIDKQRSGVLVIDYHSLGNASFNYMNKIRDFGNEFPRTIVFCQRRGDNDIMQRIRNYDAKSPERSSTNVTWTSIARALFQTMPNPLYPRVVKDVPEGWKDIPLSMFATLYNVCLFPELITDPQLIKLMSDENQDFHNMTIT